MDNFKKYINSLNSVDQDLFVATIGNIVSDGREGRLNTIRKEAADLRKEIDAIQRIIESLRSDLSIATKVILRMKESSYSDTEDVRFVISIIEGYVISLRDKIGDLRPDKLLTRKAKLEMLCSALESRRSVAVLVSEALSKGLDMDEDSHND